MNIMTKRGNLDNVITYEHYCDTVADLSNIPLSQTTLGSVAIVVNDEDDGMGIYIANSQKEWTPISTSIGGGSGEALLDLIHICSNNEYNSVTKVPTIEDAESNKIYLVPNNESGNNVFDEWIYADEAWEKFGGGSINVPVTDVQVNGTSVVSSGVANVPTATNTTFGVIKTGGGLVSSDGVLTIAGATSDVIKPGTNTRAPITPKRQHESAYFGLSKAAGVDLANEIVTVGTYPDSAKSAIQQMLGVPSTDDIPDVPVQDVQVNGTSILDNGVANVPVASANDFGAVKIYDSLGIGIMPGLGYLTILASSADNIKNGSNTSKPVVPFRQHEAAFYGLAKAAGADMKDIASTTVGVYPQAQKNAIHSMLGTQDFVEVSFVQNVSGTTPSITGEANYRYICGEVSTISITPPNAGTIDVLFESGSTVTVLTVPNTVKFPAWFDPNNLETNTIYELLIQDGVYGSVMTWAL